MHVTERKWATIPPREFGPIDWRYFGVYERNDRGNAKTGRSKRYADDLTRRNDWLRQIQQGGLESTTTMAGNYESNMFDEQRGIGYSSNNNSSSRWTPSSNNNNYGSYGAEYATRANYLRQQQQQQNQNYQRGQSFSPQSSSRFVETNYDQWNGASPSQQYRSYYGDQEFSRAEEQYFGQLALDPRDDVAFENQFQSRRNHNYGDDFNNTGANYYHDSPAFHNKVQITDVFFASVAKLGRKRQTRAQKSHSGRLGITRYGCTNRRN